MHSPKQGLWGQRKVVHREKGAMSSFLFSLKLSFNKTINMKRQICFVFAVIIAITMACCVAKPTQTPKEINHVTVLPGFDIDSLYKAFLECSKDEGDLGCDSCWQLIMEGHVDDRYWHDHGSYFHND